MAKEDKIINIMCMIMFIMTNMFIIITLHEDSHSRVFNLLGCESKTSWFNGGLAYTYITNCTQPINNEMMIEQTAQLEQQYSYLFIGLMVITLLFANLLLKGNY